MANFYKHACYLYCLAYRKGARTLSEMNAYIAEWWSKGYCDDEGFVTQPQKIMCCKDVTKPPYKLENLTENENIVMWEYNDGTHFVVMNREGDVIFDPSGNSNTVT